LLAKLGPETHPPSRRWPAFDTVAEIPVIHKSRDGIFDPLQALLATPAALEVIA
jgi:hypothetical protein